MSTLSTNLLDQLIEIRRHLHEYPELSFQEFETANYIKAVLTSWGISYTNITETGVYVDVVGNNVGPAIALRADIDALPIIEAFESDYKSIYEGVMHACGHDVHTAILLGAVKVLSDNKERLNGTVRCIFQPGEEDEGAAKKLIKAGVLENPKIQSITALHVWPHLPFGQIGVKAGNMTASCDTFTIKINGKGGHSARPHQAIDAIIIANEVLTHINHMTVKKMNPIEPHIIHIGSINGGVAANVVADQVIMTGTTRSFSQAIREQTDKELKKICQSISILWGVEIEYDMVYGAPHIYNDPYLAKAMENMLLQNNLIDDLALLSEPSMGGDDFGYYAQKIPSLYFRLGIVKEDSGNLDLHHPQFNLDDTIIGKGVKVFTEYAKYLLNDSDTSGGIEHE